MAAAKLLYLGANGNPTPRGRAVRAHELHAARAIQRFELMQAVGGYLDYLAVPETDLAEIALVVLAKRQAEKELSEQSSGGASGSGPQSSGRGQRGGARQLNRTQGVEPLMGRDPRLPQTG